MKEITTVFSYIGRRPPFSLASVSSQYTVSKTKFVHRIDFILSIHSIFSSFNYVFKKVVIFTENAKIWIQKFFLTEIKTLNTREYQPRFSFRCIVENNIRGTFRVMYMKFYSFMKLGSLALYILSVMLYMVEIFWCLGW